GTLGVGGYGAVYRVEPLDAPGRSFALKLSLHPDPARALREMALLLDRAWHPHVVRVHATGRWPDPVDGLPYFVMDFIEGMALHTWAETFNPTFRQLAMVGGSVAMTLDVLHARGVLHRDLKPEHILIREPGHVPVLIDFGAGDQMGSTTLTTTTLPPGTLHLRSPEAIRFQQLHWRQPELRYPYTESDDLYALGVCLYRAATGHPPFSPELAPDLLTVVITTRPPPSPRAINPQVPEPFARAILRLLKKAPEQRPRTGVQAHAELMEALLSDGDAFEARLFEEASDRIRRPAWPSQPYPASVTEPMAPPAPHASSRIHMLGLTACLGLVLAGAGTWRVLAHTTPRVQDMASTSTGHKLAIEPERPQSVPVAPPPPEVHAAVTPKPPAPSPKSGRSLKPAALAACMGLACATGAPLVDRPQPPSEDCPAAAIEAMEKLGIAEVMWDAEFDHKFANKNVTVREGRATAYTSQSWGRVSAGTKLTGTVYVGAQRVYGRFTQLRHKKTGETHPVCIELVTVEDGLTGLPRLKGGDEDTAILSNEITIRSVLRYDD
ncbi:serine/threonine protein kinase, partial [Corallococcus llansteffanensis]